MFKTVVLAAFLAATAGGAQAANEADLAAIRSQIAELKQSYEQRIAALEKRLAEAEARPAMASALPAEIRPQPASTASAFNPEVSLILQGQYRNAKDVAGRQRGFSADETELVLAANIDPYWRGQAIVSMLDGTAEVEEAWFQSLGLGSGLGLKGGRFRSGIGYLNEQHPHARDFADAPLVYQMLFGEAGSYAQDGVQLKWLAPGELFVEFGGELGRGANFPGSERNKNGSGAGAAFVHVGGDLGDSHDWRLGLSYLGTRAEQRPGDFPGLGGDPVEGLFSGTARTWLADFVWKWAPNGNPKYENLKLQAEYARREERGDLLVDGNADGYRSRQSGWYAQGVYQFTPNWRGGLRYEQLDSGSRDFGANAATFAVDTYKPKKTTAMLDYSWSEFSRVRLQYAQDKSLAGLTDDQITVQYIMSLGAHGAHKF